MSNIIVDLNVSGTNAEETVRWFAEYENFEFDVSVSELVEDKAIEAFTAELNEILDNPVRSEFAKVHVIDYIRELYSSIENYQPVHFIIEGKRFIPSKEWHQRFVHFSFDPEWDS